MIGHRIDPRGWWWFTFTTGNANVYYPALVAGVPVGQGGTAASAGAAPASRVAPAGRKVLLRSILPLGPGVTGGPQFQVRPGDGVGNYFGSLWIYGSAAGNATGPWASPMAIPLYDGISIGSQGTAVQSFVVCFEPL